VNKRTSNKRMMNKRTIIGLVSAGALFAGVGIARTAVVTERVVTDEALSLAQQTGQPVWETYQRNVWLAWVGCTIAVGGVSGVAAALYAREEEIDEISLRASDLRDRTASVLPQIRTLFGERTSPALPARERDRVRPAASDRPDRFAAPELEASEIAPPEIAPPNIMPPTFGAVDSVNSDAAPIAPSAPGDDLRLSPTLDSPEASAPEVATPDDDRSVDLSDDRAAALHTPIDLDANAKLDHLFESESGLNFTLEADTADPSAPPAREEALVSDRNEFVEHFSGSLGPPLARSLEDDEIARPDRDEPSERAESGTPLSERSPLEIVASSLETSRSAASPAEIAAPAWFAALVTAPALCVAGDDLNDTVARTKTDLLEAIVAQRLDLGHECVVCDPLGQATHWHGCKRFGQNEDYPAIDAAIAAIVAEIETRSIAANDGQTDFGLLTLACFSFSLWVELCASSPLLVARAKEAARVSVFLLAIEDELPPDWTAFGQSELAFPDDLFLELAIDAPDANTDDRATPTARVRYPRTPRHAANERGSTAGTSAEIDLSALRDTALARAPRLQSRLPLPVPDAAAAPTPESVRSSAVAPTGRSPLQNPDETGYPMTDRVGADKLRSQIALFQSLNMTREQIIVAVWDVRDPTSAEYELASTFYDRLTS